MSYFYNTYLIPLDDDLWAQNPVGFVLLVTLRAHQVTGVGC